MSATLLCETVTGSSMAELLRARDAATAADMVELRLDGVGDLDVASALHGCPRPVVATCRPLWEGGRFGGSEEERCRVLARALDLGADYVDVEWAATRMSDGFRALIARAPARVLLSMHDFAGVPADLGERARAMRAAGTTTIKIAVTTPRLGDTVVLRAIARGGQTVVIGMGDAGVASRLLAARYGSRWTYAGNGVAPGQIPAARMLSEFRFRAISSTTRLFGVVSTKAMHSLSPVMHNAAFAASGVDAVYVPMQTDDFDDFLEFASALGIEGASVTIPFKHDALRAASQVDDLGVRVGAVNTLRQLTDGPGETRPGRRPAWAATNTDVAGFLAPLAEVWNAPLRGARVAVLGAGGAARAVVVALVSRGARVAVHARRADQAIALVPLGAEPGPWPIGHGTWDILVNCTPLGGADRRDESPLRNASFTGRLVYDLTYGAGESALLRDARRAGCLTLDGLPMLIAQAEGQFEWWTGGRAAPGVMRDAAEARLGLRAPGRIESH